jgi:hypothetical protein
MVQAMMLFEGYIPPVTGPAVISASPTVNGISIEPSGHGGITHLSVGQQCPSNVTFCTITGMFWLDLDAAEDAHKGMFLGQPLDIRGLQQWRRRHYSRNISGTALGEVNFRFAPSVADEDLFARRWGSPSGPMHSTSPAPASVRTSRRLRVRGGSA